MIFRKSYLQLKFYLKERNYTYAGNAPNCMCKGLKSRKKKCLFVIQSSIDTTTHRLAKREREREREREKRERTRDDRQSRESQRIKGNSKCISVGIRLPPIFLSFSMAFTIPTSGGLHDERRWWCKRIVKKVISVDTP